MPRVRFAARLAAAVTAAALGACGESLGPPPDVAGTYEGRWVLAAIDGRPVSPVAASVTDCAGRLEIQQDGESLVGRLEVPPLPTDGCGYQGEPQSGAVTAAGDIRLLLNLRLLFGCAEGPVELVGRREGSRLSLSGTAHMFCASGPTDSHWDFRFTGDRR